MARCGGGVGFVPQNYHSLADIVEYSVPLLQIQTLLLVYGDFGDLLLDLIQRQYWGHGTGEVPALEDQKGDTADGV